jgi:hypothetical protein
MALLKAIAHSWQRVALLAHFCIAPLCVALPVSAQDTTRTAPPPPSPGTPARVAARLLVVFRPPVRGVRRERALTRGDAGARALIPSANIDSLIPQTLRDAPFVAVCAAGEPDSARLVVRIGDIRSTAMIPLKAGLNRIALGDTHMYLRDGDVAEWSLRTRSGEVFLQELIQRQVVPSTPTISALARNGIWYDALDLFVLDASRGIPLAPERLDRFLMDVGAEPCAVTAPPK